VHEQGCSLKVGIIIPTLVGTNERMEAANEIKKLKVGLLSSDTPSADIAPSPVDGIVNFLYFAVLVENYEDEEP
jgi:hypothetical protein